MVTLSVIVIMRKWWSSAHPCLWTLWAARSWYYHLLLINLFSIPHSPFPLFCCCAVFSWVYVPKEVPFIHSVLHSVKTFWEPGLVLVLYKWGVLLIFGLIWYDNTVKCQILPYLWLSQTVSTYSFSPVCNDVQPVICVCSQDSHQFGGRWATGLRAICCTIQCMPFSLLLKHDTVPLETFKHFWVSSPWN